MLSTEPGARPGVRLLALGQRFQKFIVVGLIGLAVNQVALWGLVGQSEFGLAVASPIAILLSMVVTFLLNEAWTWHDRGRGRIGTRALLYGTINSGGLLINAGLLLFLEREFGVHYLIANLVGAGVAAIWNFALNHVITWRS